MEVEELLIQDSVAGASNETKIQKTFRHFVDLFYEVFYLLYKDYNSTNRFDRTSKKVYIHCFFMILYLLQLLSLTFPCIQIKDYQKYDWFFSLTAICRIDYLFVILGIGLVFYAVALFIVLVPAFSIGVMYYELLTGKRVKEANYRYTLVWPLKLTNEHLYISLFSIFAVVFEVSVFKKTQTYEYRDYDLSQLNVPFIGPATVLFMYMLLVLSLLEQLFNTEQYITRNKAVPFARPHSRVEALKTIFITAFILSHHFLHEDNYAGHLALGLAGSIALAGLYIYYLPFYSQLVNFTHASVFTCLSLGILAQIISTTFQEVTLIFVFVLIMTPILCIIVWDLVSKRKSFIEKHYISRFAKLPSIYECELTIRFEIEKYLQAKSEKNKEKKAHYRSVIIDLFHILQKRFSYHKLPSIWEFIFFFHIIKEENLARLKLAQALKGKYDFEASYHYFKYIKVLVDFSTTYSEEVDYIRFKQLYDKAKLQDEDTCRLQLDFWTELSHEHPNIPKLETLGEKLYAMIEKTNKACKKLYKRYPERALSLKLYGSFLMDVYNDTEKGNDLVSRGENLKWQTELKGFTGEKFSYFDENVGLLVVSGTPGSLGMVQYMSPEASEILGVPLKLGINMHICNFSPPPMNNIPYHNQCIERYLSQTDYSEVPLPFSFFIIDTNSNLVEVYMQNRCVAIDSYPFFLVTLKRTNKPRDCLIYAEDFTIIAHTKDFATLIGYQESKSLIALNLNVVIPRASEIYEAKRTDNYIEYPTSRGSVLYIKFQDLSVGSVIYRLLYITAEQSETKVNINKLNPLSGFQELLQSRFKSSVSMKQDSVIPEKRGILKDTRFKAPKKDLKVSFNEDPYILIIEETDFEAGHNDPHKKDAAPIKKPRETGVEDEELNISITSPEKTEIKSDIKPEAVIDTNLEILDLKDLMDLTIDNEGKSNGASSVAGMSASEGIVKRSSASVASSAVSSNASVSSSAAAQLLLSKVNGSMLKFKCTFLLTVVLVILAVLAMMIYIIVTVDHYNQTVLITEMSELRCNSVLISEYIRFLQLINIGYIPISQESSYRNLLINTTDSFSSLIQKLYDEKDQWTDSNQDLLMDPRIVTWNMYDLSYNMSTISLIDSLRNIARESKIISATELTQITADNANFYYIYRNGVGETLNQLNTTVFSFIEHEKENLDYILSIVLFLGISAITLMVICFVAVILPTIISVEQSNQNVWKFFYKLPLDVVQEMKFRCEERLETLHGIELEKKGSEHQKFKNIEKRELIKNSTKWPVIVLKLSIYYIISAAFFVFFYFMVYEEFGKMLTYKPEIINWAGIRTMSMHRSLFWFIENSLKSTPDSIYNIIPTHSIIDDPMNFMRQDFEAMRYAEDLLLQGKISNFGLTGEHEDLLFKDGCLTASCIYLKRGLHSALISIESDFIEYTNHEARYSDLSYIWNQNQEIIDLLNKMVKLYEDEIDNMLDESRGLMIGITVCYSATVLILYIFLYVPSINRVRLQVTQIWDNSRLIPIVLLDRIIRAWNKDGKKITF